jgi:hypothetical protein
MRSLAVLLAIVSLGFAGSRDFWKNGDPAQWTPQEIQHLLTDSPWSQQANATFPQAEDEPAQPAIEVPQAGMPNPRNAATDGRWDGGVGRNNRGTLPTLNVTVRWDSALPVREALGRQHAPAAYSPEQIQKYYLVSVAGLVPAGRYMNPTLNTRSGDDTFGTRNPQDPRNPEEMLEGVMHYARLFPHGKAPIRPDDAKLDPAGTILLFFPRTSSITLDDKDVTFEVRFGSLSVTKKFRLKDMVYKGELAL